jgi:hypothetical protein
MLLEVLAVVTPRQPREFEQIVGIDGGCGQVTASSVIAGGVAVSACVKTGKTCRFEIRGGIGA